MIVTHRVLVCSSCARREFPKAADYLCSCGGLYDLVAAASPALEIDPREPSLWRYRSAMAGQTGDAWRSLTLGEGWTPLVILDAAQPRLRAKLEYLSPTLSFKDRGAVTLVAAAQAVGAKRLVADSSGNAGTAIAAYAARANIACDVYVPAATSHKKLRQIEAHGARVHTVDGTREETASQAIAAVEATGAYYASHVFNPFFYEGTKTYALEIFEQSDGSLPDALIVPVGNGTLLLGAFLGLELLQAMYGMPLPRLIAVQSERCAPVARAFEHGMSRVTAVENEGTEAEGIAIAAPRRGDQILAAIRATGGGVVTVTESEIIAARSQLAALGAYVEPTAAVNWAAVDAARRRGLLHSDESVVLPLCGAGLKAP